MAHASCLTCGTHIPPAAESWDDDGEPVAAPVFCSIHCEHYHGLMRASEAVHSHAD